MSYGFIEDNHVYPFKSSEQKEIQKDKEGYLLDEVILRQPSFPSKVIAVGLNYSDHAKELNMKIPDEPIIFMKPSKGRNSPRKISMTNSFTVLNTLIGYLITVR